MVKILVVNHHPQLLGTLARGLRMRGFDVLQTYTVNEAIEQLRYNAGALDLVVVDLNLGGQEYNHEGFYVAEYALVLGVKCIMTYEKYHAEDLQIARSNAHPLALAFLPIGGLNTIFNSISIALALAKDAKA